MKDCLLRQMQILARAFEEFLLVRQELVMAQDGVFEVLHVGVVQETLEIVRSVSMALKVFHFELRLG